MCNNWTKISNVHHFKVKQHFIQFYLMGLSDSQNNVWRGMLMTMIWSCHN